MKEPIGFKKAKLKAQEIVKDNNKLMSLVDLAKEKVDSSKERFAEGVEDMNTFLRLLKAYALGEYREVSLASIIIIVAAIVYFLNPLDLIPDIIISIGFLDDLTVLAYAAKTLKNEVDRFNEWERINNEQN